MVTSFDDANGGILGLVGGTLYFSGTMAPTPGLISAPAKGGTFADDKYETAGVYIAHADGKTSELIDGEHSPGNIRFMHMDATYLVWMDGDDSGQTRLHAVKR